MATADGTRRFLQRAVERGLLHPANVRHLGQPQLSCSASGFGAYRVGGGDQEVAHGLAMRSALRAGMNLFDTSSHYSEGSKASSSSDPASHSSLHGASERLVGRVIAEAADAGEASRDELIVCTKLGHVARGVEPPPGAVSIGTHSGDAGSDDWHSIEPGFVESEVHASKERLGTVPDFVLLHNPEYLLSMRLKQKVSIGDAWDEMYAALTESFKVLERLCSEGQIASGYGVSSNFLSCSFSNTGRSNVYEALVLERVVEAAAAAAKSQGSGEHRMRIAQMPLNAFESGALLGRGAVVPEAAEGDCHSAARLGVSVITNRPLHAIPIPGVSTGDWGRSGDSHLHLREVKPMGTMPSLVKRVLVEALRDGGVQMEPAPPLQQVALRLAISAPVSLSLIGARSERYVEDVSAVLQAEPFSGDQVKRAMLAVRTAAEELGCERRGFW
ncbi:unnamed protein product [Polarella glacialis]|uniref:NADP-dependent oxidoreductase domain-containing protein n=1 Tax=Polarella glacialis TaxID=89957 RepID=A0A813DEB8_POLGL|nr:unnamed protein product [Polarella glacialis]CAE8679602.1 unnamed protein product [Polarella glacialis]